jgi:hypothetical protein
MRCVRDADVEQLTALLEQKEMEMAQQSQAAEQLLHVTHLANCITYHTKNIVLPPLTHHVQEREAAWLHAGTSSRSQTVIAVNP